MDNYVTMTALQTINAIANQPEVLRFVAPGCDRVDLAGFFDRPANVAVWDTLGAMLFGAKGDGTYEAHYLFTIGRRGKEALDFAREAFNTMFTTHGATAIFGSIVRDNRAARVMSRALGCIPCGEFIDERGEHRINYIMERGRWATLLAD